MNAADARPLRSDDRALKRELRARERLERQAYKTGLSGAAWEPELWPEGLELWDAYAAGTDERRARRRDRRHRVMLRAAHWCGRRMAPRTARRLRRARRRLRAVWR